VSESSSDSQVATEVVDGVGSGVPGETLLSKGGLVERPIGVEDSVLVVLRSVGVEKILREEGELSGVPRIGSVHSAEDDAAETDTGERHESQLVEERLEKGEKKKDEPDELGDLGGEGSEEGTERSSSRSDVSPIEAD